MTLTAKERGDLAQRLVPIAATLTCVVHGDGDQRNVIHILNQLDAIERDALIVVLAGLVDPDRPFSQVLSYLAWDEHGAPAKPTSTVKTIRQAAKLVYLPIEEPTQRSAEIVATTQMLAGRGLTRGEIADRLQLTWGHIRKAHTLEGARVPEVAA